MRFSGREVLQQPHYTIVCVCRLRVLVFKAEGRCVCMSAKERTLPNEYERIFKRVEGRRWKEIVSNFIYFTLFHNFTFQLRAIGTEVNNNKSA